MSRIILCIVLNLLVSHGHSFLVLDAKSRLVLLNEGTGLSFSDGIDLCHRLGGQLPQVTTNKDKDGKTIAEDPEFLALIMKYAEEDIDKDRENFKHRIWLGAKKGPGEESYSWLTEAQDTVDKTDETWEQMDSDVENCDKDKCCALTLAPPKIKSDATRKYRVVAVPCENTDVRVLCRLNIDLQDIPKHGTVQTLIKNADDLDKAVKEVGKKTDELTKKQDEIEKSDILKDVKESVKEIKTQIESLKKTIEEDGKNLETAKKEAVGKVEKIKEDVDKESKDLNSKVQEITKGINELKEKLPKDRQSLQNLLNEHRKAVDKDLDKVKKKVTETTKLSQELDAKLTKSLESTKVELTNNINKYDEKNKELLATEDAKFNELSKKWEKLDRDMKDLQERANNIVVDDELKERAKEASKKADDLIQGLDGLKKLFTEKFDDVAKTADNVKKELKDLQDEANPVGLQELKDNITNLSSNIKSDKSSFQGMKIATWVILALFAVMVIGQTVFLYRKRIIPRFGQMD